jgi:hypothetical protein
MTKKQREETVAKLVLATIKLTKLSDEQKEVAHAAANDWERLAIEVILMRKAQKAYYHSILRSAPALIKAIQCEQIVDAALKEILEHSREESHKDSQKDGDACPA